MSGVTADAPMFTVGVPVYNRAELVGATLESILSQTFRDFEIVAVNDGSKDASLDVLRAYEPRGVRVVDQPNAGLAGARNTAAAHARGRYIIFLDSDDVFFPWSLETFARAVRDHTVGGVEPAMVSGSWPPFDKDADLARVTQQPYAARAFKDYLSTRARRTKVAPSATAVRVDVYRRTGASDAVRVMFEDVDIWFKVGAEAGYVHIDAPAVAGYRVGHAQMMGNMQKQLDGYDWIAGKVARGEYASGGARRREMQDALALHAKGCALRCLHQRDKKRAMAFYRRSVLWNARCGDWKFVLALPVLAMLGRGVASRDMKGLAAQTVSAE